MKLYLLLIPIFIIISTQFAISNVKLLHFPARDFKDFYASGLWVRNGQDPNAEPGKDIVRNPPPSFILFTLFSLFPLLQIQLIWFTLSLIFFLIGTYYLLKILNWNNLKFWFSILSLVLIFFPFRYNLGSGQVNNLLYMLIVLCFYFSRYKKDYLASLSLSLAIILKITPLFLLLTLLLEKRLKILFLTFLNLAIINFITVFALGTNLYSKFLTASGSFFDFSNPVYYNQTLSAFLFRVSSNDNIVGLFDLTLLIIFILIFIFSKKPFLSDKLLNRITLWNISIIYMLIFAPFAWQYHFVIIIFPLLTTLYMGLKRSYNFVFFVLLFFSYILLGLNIKNPNSFSEYGLLGRIILSHTFFGAIILLFLNLYPNLKKGFKLRS